MALSNYLDAGSKNSGIFVREILEDSIIIIVLIKFQIFICSSQNYKFVCGSPAFLFRRL